MLDDFYDNGDVFVYKIVEGKKRKTDEESSVSSIPRAEYYFWYTLESTPIYNSVFLYDTPLDFIENTDDKLQEPFFLPESSLPSSSLSSCKMLNLKETNVRDFLSKLPTHLVETKLIALYFHLLKGVQILVEKQLLHMDIHENNIVVDQYTHNSYICDYDDHSFLSSSVFSKVNPEWFQIFRGGHQHYENEISAATNYPLDIVILSFIFKEFLHDMTLVDAFISDAHIKSLKELTGKYFKQNLLFSKEDKKVLKENWNHCFKLFVNKPWKFLLYHLVQNSLSWDMFALDSIFYKFAEMFLWNPDVKNSFQLFLKEKLLHRVVDSR